MSYYNHVLVSELNPKMSRDPATGDLVCNGNSMTSASHLWWVDNIPVTKQLYEFATELRKQCPNYKFGAIRIGHTRYDGMEGGHKFKRLAVYVDSCEYILGQIGYGDFYISHDTNTETYMVYSRTIKNKKINVNNEQHHMLMSVDMKRGVKNAAKSLRIYSLREIANRSVEEFSQSLRYARADVVQGAQQIVGRIKHDVLVTELRHLIRSGVSFVTPEFKDAAVNFMAADEEAEKAKRIKYGGYFVMFTKTGPNRDVLQASVLTYSKGLDERNEDPTPEGETVMPAADLPEDIQAKIAVLSMSADNTWVPGVGMKVTDTSYWIEQATT